MKLLRAWNEIVANMPETPLALVRARRRERELVRLVKLGKPARPVRRRKPEPLLIEEWLSLPESAR